MSGAMTPHSNRTTVYSQAGNDADSTAPMLYRSSGLRQGYTEDTKTDREESMYDDQYEGEGSRYGAQSRDGSEAMHGMEPKRF